MFDGNTFDSRNGERAGAAMIAYVDDDTKHRPGCYGDPDDPIPGLFATRQRLWWEAGSSLPSAPDSFEKARVAIAELADQVDFLLAAMVARSVEGLSAQIRLLTIFMESDPWGEYEGGADKRLLESIHAGLQGLINRAQDAWKSEARS